MSAGTSTGAREIAAKVLPVDWTNWDGTEYTWTPAARCRSLELNGLERNRPYRDIRPVQLPKLRVAGSSPVSRSRKREAVRHLRRHAHLRFGFRGTTSRA